MSVLKVPVNHEDHIQGDEHAVVTLVEYGDFECPYCGLAYPVIKQLQQHFDKQLRFVFRQFPLTEVHPHAEAAAEASEFADDYGRFWEIHDLIYENQKQLSLPFLIQLAEQLQLPVKDLEFALEKHLYHPKVQKDFMSGVKSGVNGTPGFFINEHFYNGPVDFESLSATIEAALKVKSS